MRRCSSILWLVVVCGALQAQDKAGKQPARAKPQQAAPAARLGGWEAPEPIEQNAAAVSLEQALPLYARAGKGRPPLAALLHAIEQENQGALDRAQYFQLIGRYTRVAGAGVRGAPDAQQRLEAVSRVFFGTFGLRYQPVEPTRPQDLFLSELLATRRGGPLQFALLYLAVGRAVGLGLYPARAGDELVLRLAGTQLTVVPAQEGDVRPLAYHLQRHRLKQGTELPLVSQTELLGELLERRARLLAASGRKPEALRDYERVLLLRPGRQPALIELASLYDATKQPDKAQRMLTMLIGQGAATPEIYWRRAEILIRRRQWEAAIKDLQAYLGEHGEDARAWYLIGTAQEGRGELQAAVKAYEQAAQSGDANIASLARVRVRAIRGPYLLGRFRGARDYAARVAALQELARLGDPAVTPTLVAALNDDNLRLRWQIAGALRRIHGLPEEQYLRLGIDQQAWAAWWARQRERMKQQKK